MTNTAKATIAGILVAVFFLALPVYHMGQRFVHWITEPDKTICVSGHYSPVPVVISTGKSTTIVVQQVWDCDKEAPNPKYVEQMKKWNASKP